MAPEPDKNETLDPSTLRQAQGRPVTSNQEPEPEKQLWPLSWILIVILAYIALQTAYFLFFAE